VDHRASRAELLDYVVVGLAEKLSPILAGCGVGLVDVRLGTENLLRLSFRIGE